MKVLIISTTERTGGGAIAAKRLLTALNKNGIQAKMLVREKQTDDINVAAYGNKWPKIKERLRLMCALQKPFRQTWQYDLALDGVDILSTPEYKEADVIHLHWVNQGMLSLKQLKQMLASGKRIVWTMHDEWPFRGIKHYTDDNNGKDDNKVDTLEHKMFATKQEIYAHGSIHFVGCSQWITDLGREAMPQASMQHINNCIPHSIFHAQNKQEAREVLSLPRNKKLILFTCQKVTDKRKGISYMLEALQHLHEPKPHLVVVGGDAESMLQNVDGLNMNNIHFIPYVDGEKNMARLYSAVDCFVTPSLQDNLPNTIAEAMSCGTPCVGFNTGGIPEMITHMQNGYVARYLDSQDLAHGIECTLEHPEWCEAATRSALHDYSEDRVAREYGKIYGIH